MTMNYASYVSQLSNLMVVPDTDPNFQIFLPGCIDYAEGRIYRELDLLNETVVDATGTMQVNVRDFTLPTAFGTYIVVSQINVITPAGSTASNGTRNSMTPTSREIIDTIYPNAQLATGVPLYYAAVTGSDYVLGPTPDQTYNAEVVGIQRPQPLSITNSSTPLTQYVPDLMLAASMVFATGFQRDFGAQSDNPQISQSWESQYKLLFASAQAEQLRAQSLGSAWTQKGDAPSVTPPRV